jgi:hypothetical protein
MQQGVLLSRVAFSEWSAVETNIGIDVWRKGGQMQVTCSFGRSRVPAKTKTTRWIEARGMRDSERAHKHSIRQYHNTTKRLARSIQSPWTTPAIVAPIYID